MNKPVTQKSMIGIIQCLFDATSNQINFYQKNGYVNARRGITGEEIITMIDGEKETQKTVGLNEVVIMGPKNELYVVSEEKFNQRYRVLTPLLSEFQMYQATGLIMAYQHNYKPYEFIASWGEKMICNTGDYLAAPITSLDQTIVTEVYRIEQGVFNKTYTHALPDY